MPCLKTSLCYSVRTELQTHLFLGSVRVFSVMKITTLASCQGTESCPGDDLLNSTVCSWTYSWVIRTGRDLKNHSALLFYIWETQNLNWWVPSSVSNEWKARSPDASLGLLMPSFYWINWLFHCIDAGKRCWLKNVLWNDKLWGIFLTHRTMIHISLKDLSISDLWLPNVLIAIESSSTNLKWLALQTQQYDSMAWYIQGSDCLEKWDRRLSASSQMCSLHQRLSSRPHEGCVQLLFIFLVSFLLVTEHYYLFFSPAHKEIIVLGLKYDFKCPTILMEIVWLS